MSYSLRSTMKAKRTAFLAKQSFSTWFMIGMFITCFSLGYSSVVSNDYGFLDDYNDIIDENQGPTYRKKYLEGRPLYSILTEFAFSMVTDFTDLRYVRLGGVISIFLLAFTLFQVLVRTGWKPFQSCCVSIIMCTSLPFQIYAGWATTSFFPLAGLMSGCACILAESAFRKSSRSRWALGCMSILTLLAAFTIYQAAAMLFLVFAAVFMFKPNSSLKDTSTRFLWFGLIISAGMLLAFVVYKSALIFYPNASLRTGIAQNISEKILFLYESLPKVLSFCILSPRRLFYSWQWQDESILYNRAVDDGVVVWLSLPIIITGLMLYFSGTRVERLSKCVMALSIFVLSFTPLLVMEKAPGGYRVLVAPVSLVVLYLYFAFRGWLHLCCSSKNIRIILANTILAITTGVTILLCAYHVRNWLVEPQVKELEIMSHPLTAENLSNAERIYLIVPAHFWSETFAPFVHWEFGQASSSPEVNVNSPAMIFGLLRRMAPDYAQLPVITLPSNGFIDPLPGDLVVDMRNFRTRWVLYRWIRENLSLGTHIIKGTFDVYLDEDSLYYVKSSCLPEDVEERFFLHVVPVDPNDLSVVRKEYGSDNLDFDWHGVIYQGKCMAVVRRPDYSIRSVKTGQFTIPGMEVLWEGVKTISLDNSK